MQVRSRATRPASLHREIKFGRAELKIVPPFGLRIKTEWRSGEQVPTGRGVSKIKNMFCRRQALVGVGRIAGLIFVETESESCSHASREVGADLRAGLYLAG